MVAIDTDDGRIRSPRAVFAERFGELHAAAGNPTLRRVATAAENRMRAARGNRPGGASAQRISDWKAGRNVPARFESLLPVVLSLVELAGKAGNPLPRELADPAEWQRLWREATSWNPEEDTEAACPYPGLRAYAAEQRSLFFGRTRAVAELTDAVRSATGITAVIGASGAGKSSLLAAGLAPALGDWQITTLTPGAHPYEALLEALGGPATEQQPEAIGQPTEGDEQPERTKLPAPEPSDGGVALAVLAARNDGVRRLVIVDQLEELFTACADERERELFLSVLDGCAGRADDPVAVVVALRADFYAHCLNHLILQDALEHRGYLLGPLRMDELSQAVSGPARAVGLELEPGLEELITSELCGAGDHHGRRTYDPGALPLLSHVMAATWQHREGRRLTIAGYRRAGGVVGSVAETAEYAWNELTSAQQRAARDLLLGLVTVSQDARDTRRTVPRDELLRRTDAHEDATAALELLARTRLITLDADAVTLTHEIVLTAWPRLRTWIDEDRVGYLIRQRLETDAAEWAAQERDPALLYRGSRLQSARDHADPPPVGPLAQEFLTRSATAVSATRRRSRGLRAALAVLGVGLLVVGFGLYSQLRLADQRDADSQFAAVLAAADRVQHTDPSLAAQLNLAAWQLRPGDSTVRSRLLQSQATPLVTVTPAHTDAITQIAFQPAVHTLASLDTAGNLRLWDTADPKHPRARGPQLTGIEGVVLDTTARLMVTSSRPESADGGTRGTNPFVTLWDIVDPATPRRLTQVPMTSLDAQLALSPDGRTLVTMGWDEFTLWDIGNPAAPVPRAARTLPVSDSYGGAGTVRFSPDGRLLARANREGSPSLNSVQLWDVSQPNNPTLLAPAFAITPESAGQTGVVDLEFRPDSAVLAVGITPESGSHGVAQLWDLADPGHPRLASSREIDRGSMTALAFAPDGRTLAVAVGESVAVWNVTDPADPALLVDDLAVTAGSCHSAVDDHRYECLPEPRTVAFTTDGRSVLAGTSTGDIHTWSLPTALTATVPGSDEISGFAANGTELAVGLANRDTATLWDIRNLQAPRTITQYRFRAGLGSSQLSSDGTLLLTMDIDRGTVTVLDVTDPAAIHARGTWTFPDPSAFRYWNISPDFRTAVTIDAQQMMQLWDLTDPSHTTPLGAAVPLTENGTFSFGADGKSMIETSAARTPEQVTTLWSLADRSHPSRVADLLRVPESDGASVVIAPDLRTMVVSEKGSVQAWDIGDPHRIRKLGGALTGKLPAAEAVSFTPDSQRLLARGSDGAVQLWDFTDRAHPTQTAALTSTAGYGGTGAAMSLGNNYLAAITTEGTLALWDLDTQHAIDRICSITGEFWTRDLWHRYVPQLPYSEPCRTGS
ncbi:nSTAND1 domain-containing NTPase [Nocardia sp. NPDC004722]